MKDNTDMFFVKDMAVSDYDKFFGTTDGGFNMCVEGCAPGHEGIIPLGTVVLNDTPFLAYRSTIIFSINHNPQVLHIVYNNIFYNHLNHIII